MAGATPALPHRPGKARKGAQAGPRLGWIALHQLPGGRAVRGPFGDQRWPVKTIYGDEATDEAEGDGVPGDGNCEPAGESAGAAEGWRGAVAAEPESEGADGFAVQCDVVAVVAAVQRVRRAGCAAEEGASESGAEVEMGCDRREASDFCMDCFYIVIFRALCTVYDVALVTAMIHAAEHYE